ncbi:MAG: 3D domain-containing protein [Planctomycetota bacterium]
MPNVRPAIQDAAPCVSPWASRFRIAAELGIFAIAIVITAWSAIVVKSASVAPLAVVERERTQPIAIAASAASAEEIVEPDVEYVVTEIPAEEANANIRWFGGRPVRPARTIMMKVTAYSPDHRSCGVFADGKTATLHSVYTNGMKLVAADTDVLPFGSMLTIPGYAEGEIVPVLDRGGAIKGNRLDVLYPTHRVARKWGVRDLPVVVWEYADGKPAPNPRKVR